MIRETKNGNQRDVLIVDDEFPFTETRIDDGESLSLRIVFTKPYNFRKTRLIVDGNAKLSVHLADFSPCSSNIDITVELTEPGAEVEWLLSSLASGNVRKEVRASAIHHAPNTSAKISNYGIASETGNLSFLGTNSILKGAKGSVTEQTAKVIVFDETAKGRASPILEIDENDVVASHAAVVGRLNDQHLFYLVSRGVSEREARELIALGYLNPVIDGFHENDVKELIAKAIQGGFSHA